MVKFVLLYLLSGGQVSINCNDIVSVLDVNGRARVVYRVTSNDYTFAEVTGTTYTVSREIQEQCQKKN